MAEFTEVMRQRERMCANHICCDGCPIWTYCEDLEGVPHETVENAIMKWAEENPEIKQKEDSEVNKVTNSNKVKDGEINIGVNVDSEKLQDTCDMLEAINNDRPNITIRNNDSVYITINYFNETAEE